MLRTTPESVNETQPTASPDTRYTVVFDGRLDNIPELRRILASDIELPEGTADAAFVLAAYRRWREQCVAHLLGDFVFAIWDSVERRLFCARDPFGVKPFYFTSNRRVFGFASDHEALLQLPSVSAAVNEDRIAALLVESFDAYDSSISWLAEVRKLEPGHWMHVYPDGRSVTHSYWSPTAPPLLVLRDQREYVDAFNEVFLAAVGCRMRSNSSPALMLSGGVDSGSIAAATRASRLSHWPTVHAVSMLGKRSEVCDESSNIRSVRESLGMRGPILTVDELDAGELDAVLNRELWAASHPVRNSLPLPLLMYERASRAGHRVMLDGIEGDLVTYAPAHYIAHLIKRFHIGQAWREATLAQQFHTQRFGSGRERIFFADLLRAVAPAQAMSWRRSLLAKRDISIPTYVSAAFVDRLRLRERTKQQMSDHPTSKPDSVAGRLRMLRKAPGLRVGLEGMAMVGDRFALEPRHPWSDGRLVNFFLSLPVERRVRDGWTKHLVRSWTAKRVAPAAVWHSGKAHLGWQVILRAMKVQSAEEPQNGALHAYRSAPYFERKSLTTVFLAKIDGNDDWQSHSLAYTVHGLECWINRIDTLGNAG